MTPTQTKILANLAADRLWNDGLTARGVAGGAANALQVLYAADCVGGFVQHCFITDAGRAALAAAR